MSSPLQKPNPPIYNNNQEQGIIIASHKVMSHSEEEVQLLEEYNDTDNDHNKELPNVKTRYISAPFIWFVSASTILPLGIIVCLFLMDPETPFSLAFALGIITVIVGACYFIPFIALKKALSETYTINQHKRMNVDKLRTDLKKLDRFHTELGATKQKILQNNKETKLLVKGLREMNVDSMEELNAQTGKAKKIYREWFACLIKKERVLLHTLYDRFEFQDNSPGMTKTEFDHFVTHLPDGYAERMERLGTFNKLSKDTGLILHDDFQSALDIFAEMELNDEDIDFEIEKQETGTDDTGQKTFASSIVKRTKSVKNKWLNKSNKEP